MYYKPVFIKSADDLPKEGEKRWAYTKVGNMIFTDLSWTYKVNKAVWYFEPTEYPEIQIPTEEKITDADIEVWADKECSFQIPIENGKEFKTVTNFINKRERIIGAKAFRDNEIKHIDK